MRIEDLTPQQASEEALRLVDDEAAPPREAIARPLSEVEPETVSWLWRGRIPFGKLTLFDGDPGVGKSLASLFVAAEVSRGGRLPDGGAVESANVVLLSAEDGLADTIRPRLDAAGADASRIHAITGIRTAATGDESFPSISTDLSPIEDLISATGARLVIVDPLMAYLGGEVNSHRDQDIRRVLAPFAAVAERHSAAVVVVRHLNKAAGGKAIHRGGASIGISGAARSVLLFARDAEQEGRVLLAAVKSNLSAPPATLAFRIDATPAGVPRIIWDETGSPLSADQILAAETRSEEDRGALAEAREFLRERLSSSPTPARDLFHEAREMGISGRTLQRASAAEGVHKRKAGLAGGWEWSLEAAKAPKVPPSTNLKTLAPSGPLGAFGQTKDLEEGVPDEVAEGARPGGLGGHCSFHVGSSPGEPCQRCGRPHREHVPAMSDEIRQGGGQ